ncbi:MAG: ABC transporter permease subunit [Candidatus Latescibacterota bacterium]
MVWIILRREILDALVGLRFHLTLGLTVLLMLAAALLFPLRYEGMVADYNQARAHALQELSRAAGQLKHLAGHLQVVSLPPSRLGFLASGHDDQLPSSVEVGISGLRRPAAASGDDDPVDLEALDWSWLVQVLLGSAAVVLTFDAFSGEKQDGTLRQVAANRVSRGAILVGKHLASLVVLLVPLAVGLLAGLLVLRLSGRVGLEGRHLVQVGLFGLASAAYLSAVVLASLLVSARTRQPHTSLVVLLVVWTVMTAVVPATGGALLGSPLAPFPTPEEASRRAAAAADEAEARAGGSTHWVGEGYEPVTRRTVEVDRQRMYAAKQVQDEYLRARLGAVTRVRALLAISPAEAFAQASEGIAGTGLARVRRFLGQAEEYRGRFEEFFQAEDMKDPDSFHLFYHIDYMSGRPVDVAQIPQFGEQEPDWRDDLVAAAAPLAVLLLWNGVLFLAAYAAFLRCDIR